MPREAVCLVAVATMIFMGIACIGVINQETREQRMKVFDFHTIVCNYQYMLDMFEEEKGMYPLAESIHELAAILEPTYSEMLKKKLSEWYAGRPPSFHMKLLDRLPRNDPWGNEIGFISWPEGKPRHYVIGSAGRDGVWEHTDLRDYEVRITRRFEGYSYDSDIIWTEKGLRCGADLE